MDKGGVLILAICSNHKQPQGDWGYDPRGSLADILPQRGEGLMTRRQEIFRLIKTEKIAGQDRLLREMPYNVQLEQGPDFGGMATRQYVPAILRYEGRFFVELGADRLKRAQESTQHLLIMSGLYGLLTPMENIQIYSCHVLHHPHIAEVWGDRRGLTALLFSYVRHYKIGRILDLTAERAYRCLIDWSLAPQGVDVLHAFGEQNAGAGSLPALGQLAQAWLGESERSLLGLRDGQSICTDYELVRLSHFTEPPPSLPSESDAQVPPTLGQKEPESVISLVMVQSEPRNIPVSSGEHTTIFGVHIRSAHDIPGRARQDIQTITRVLSVNAIYIGPFCGMSAKSGYSIHLVPPEPGSGRIDAYIIDPGWRKGAKQNLEIRVNPNEERATHYAVEKLLNPR